MNVPETPAGSAALGIGIDFIEVERITRALERQGERFRNRVFTVGELAYCDGPLIVLDEQGKALLRNKQASDVLVSLAHTRGHAVAVALLIR